MTGMLQLISYSEATGKGRRGAGIALYVEECFESVKLSAVQIIRSTPYR